MLFDLHAIRMLLVCMRFDLHTTRMLLICMLTEFDPPLVLN